MTGKRFNQEGLTFKDNVLEYWQTAQSVTHHSREYAQTAENHGGHKVKKNSVCYALCKQQMFIHDGMIFTSSWWICTKKIYGLSGSLYIWAFGFVSCKILTTIKAYSHRLGPKMVRRTFKCTGSELWWDEWDNTDDVTTCKQLLDWGLKLFSFLKENKGKVTLY